MILIDTKPLDPGIHEFEWDVSAEALDLDSETFDSVHVSVRLDFHPTRIYAVVKTQSVAHLVCDRTLVNFDQDVEGDYQVLFSSEEMYENGDSNAQDDIRFLAPDEDVIDLTEAVRDTVMLSLPHRRIAPGAETKEIQLQFGQLDGETHVDPRWEALRQLKTDENDSGSENDS